MGLSITPLPNQVAALGRSLAAERGRSLIEGGALRALEIAVGGAQARVGGACRALDRAKERLRLQQVGGAWGEGAEPLTGRGGATFGGGASDGVWLRGGKEGVVRGVVCEGGGANGVEFGGAGWGHGGEGLEGVEPPARGWSQDGVWL